MKRGSETFSLSLVPGHPRQILSGDEAEGHGGTERDTAGGIVPAHHAGHVIAAGIETGNRLFLQSGVTLQKRFTDLLAENFSSTVGEVDYKKNTEDARNTINEWTS